MKKQSEADKLAAQIDAVERENSEVAAQLAELMAKDTKETAGPIERELVAANLERTGRLALTFNAEFIVRHLDKLNARLDAMEIDNADNRDENGYSSEGEAAFYRGAGFTLQSVTLDVTDRACPLCTFCVHVPFWTNGKVTRHYFVCCKNSPVPSPGDDIGLWPPVESWNQCGEFILDAEFEREF